MADEITFKVTRVEGEFTYVTYTMGEHSIEVGIAPQGGTRDDLIRYIKLIAPRNQLKAMAAPKIPEPELMTIEGTADIDLDTSKPVYSLTNPELEPPQSS